MLDWHTRRILSWKESITKDVYFCLEAVEEAIEYYDTPKITSTDQASQFTSQAFTCLLKEYDIKISEEEKGSWRDNVFAELLWRWVKNEDIYLRAYDSASAVRTGLNQLFQLLQQSPSTFLS